MNAFTSLQRVSYNGYYVTLLPKNLELCDLVFRGSREYDKPADVVYVYNRDNYADVVQLVECLPSKEEVAGSRPVIRSKSTGSRKISDSLRLVAFYGTR